MATAWSVPRIWCGETVAVLANGPGLTREVCEAVAAANLPAIAVNDAFRLAPWAEMLYAADGGWWLHHAQTALKFRGLKVTADDSTVFGAVLSLKPGTTREGNNGFDDEPENIRTGGNGGYAAVHIAAQAGARRILLCGMDMQGSHWHGEHPAPLRNTAPATYEKWKANFETMVAPLAARGIEVLNCTPRSALRCFRRVDLSEAIDSACASEASELQ